MSKLRTLIALGLIGLLAGCASPPSLHPLYTENDLVFEPDLLGTWQDVETTLIFEEAGGDSYLLTYSVAGKASQYEAHLAALGGYLYLDVILKESEFGDRLAPQAFVSAIRAHGFYRIELDGNTLRVRHLNCDWLAEELEAGRADLRHEPLTEPDRLNEDGFLITASTEEIQRFLAEHSQDSDVFQPLTEFARREFNPVE